MAEKLPKQKETKQEEKNNKRFVIYISLLFLIIFLFIILLCQQCGKEQPAVGSGESTTKQVEISAEDIPEESTEDKLSQPKGGGSVGLVYSNKVHVNKASGKITLNFQNPSRSNQDVALEIMVQGHSIAESGRIQPGKQLNSLQMKESINMKPGSYQGIFKLTYYNTQTGKQATVDTNINIILTVAEQDATTSAKSAEPNTSGEGTTATQPDTSKKSTTTTEQKPSKPVVTTTEPGTTKPRGCFR